MERMITKCTDCLTNIVVELSSILFAIVLKGLYIMAVDVEETNGSYIRFLRLPWQRVLYCLGVLEPISLKSKCQRAMLPQKALGKNIPHVFLLVPGIAGNPQNFLVMCKHHFILCLPHHMTFSPYVFTSSFLCVYLSVSFFFSF